MKPIKTLLGFDVRKTVNYDSIKSSGSLIKGSLEAMLSRTRATYRNESFDDAIKRLELSEDRLNRRRFELSVESRIMYLTALAGILLGFYFHQVGSSLGLVPAFCVIVIGAVGGVTRAFRAHQIDKRSLMSFKDFMSDPEGWIK